MSTNDHAWRGSWSAPADPRAKAREIILGRMHLVTEALQRDEIVAGEEVEAVGDSFCNDGTTDTCVMPADATDHEQQTGTDREHTLPATPPAQDDVPQAQAPMGGLALLPIRDQGEYDLRISSPINPRPRITPPVSGPPSWGRNAYDERFLYPDHWYIHVCHHLLARMQEALTTPIPPYWERPLYEEDDEGHPMTGHWLDEVWGDVAQPGDGGDGVEDVAEPPEHAIHPESSESTEQAAAATDALSPEVADDPAPGKQEGPNVPASAEVAAVHEAEIGLGYMLGVIGRIEWWRRIVAEDFTDAASSAWSGHPSLSEVGERQAATTAAQQENRPPTPAADEPRTEETDHCCCGICNRGRRARALLAQEEDGEEINEERAGGSKRRKV